MYDRLPATLPEPHHAFIARAVELLAQDPRLVGIAAAGSFADDAMDEFSDIDLVLAVEPTLFEEVMAHRRCIAESLGSLLTAFTGEHVGEPRLLICLYDEPLLHVDLKFVALPDAARRVDEPVVLWERDGRLSAVLQSSAAVYPQPDPQWIEDRFWVWVHYAAAKIGRGELFEAIEYPSFLRQRVLGPLALQRAGQRPAGLRRLETLAPAFAEELTHTLVTSHDPQASLAALRACIAIYQRLRAADGTDGLIHRTEAERAALEYVAEIERKTHEPSL